MRVHSRWFRSNGPKSPEVVAGALAAVAWRVARAMLARMRKADFDLGPGPAYFAFLSESLAFTAQIAWRVAWESMDEEGRVAFATALGRRMAAILAENESDLLGARPAPVVAAEFIDRLNRRFEEYAEFGFGADGPDFAFMRYFASLVIEVVPERERRWVHDQVIGIEAPEAAATVARALRGLLQAQPPPAAGGRRARTTP